ncbi:MAG: hypothetical protein A3F33_02545 [Candidatus Woykebacteria bacterium RIFCSPHIGHO2_12_FULL_43_10]|nr:MAG: hypothetical protein A3F33_02545 [Candidatus Woykebacteria bacterium RIFCSPHIGHO2_12_FULL_43_10]
MFRWLYNFFEEWLDARFVAGLDKSLAPFEVAEEKMPAARREAVALGGGQLTSEQYEACLASIDRYESRQKGKKK